MWTIRCADRLRFPRVPCLSPRPAGERGEMLALAHIPTASATAPRFSTTRKTMGADRKILSRTHRPGPIISTSALDHSTIAMANDDRQRASATPADIERNRWPASIGIRWPTSIGMPGRIHRNPQAAVTETDIR